MCIICHYYQGYKIADVADLTFSQVQILLEGIGQIMKMESGENLESVDTSAPVEGKAAAALAKRMFRKKNV